MLPVAFGNGLRAGLGGGPGQQAGHHVGHRPVHTGLRTPQRGRILVSGAGTSIPSRRRVPRLTAWLAYEALVGRVPLGDLDLDAQRAPWWTAAVLGQRCCFDSAEPTWSASCSAAAFRSRTSPGDAGHRTTPIRTQPRPYAFLMISRRLAAALGQGVVRLGRLVQRGGRQRTPTQGRVALADRAGGTRPARPGARRSSPPRPSPQAGPFRDTARLRPLTLIGGEGL